jgi:hypothetical protein
LILNCILGYLSFSASKLKFKNPTADFEDIELKEIQQHEIPDKLNTESGPVYDEIQEHPEIEVLVVPEKVEDSSPEIQQNIVDINVSEPKPTELEIEPTKIIVPTHESELQEVEVTVVPEKVEDSSPSQQNIVDETVSEPKQTELEIEPMEIIVPTHESEKMQELQEVDVTLVPEEVDYSNLKTEKNNANGTVSKLYETELESEIDLGPIEPTDTNRQIGGD